MGSCGSTNEIEVYKRPADNQQEQSSHNHNNQGASHNQNYQNNQVFEGNDRNKKNQQFDSNQNLLITSKLFI